MTNERIEPLPSVRARHERDVLRLPQSCRRPATDRPQWARHEINAIVGAVRHAPSVHNSAPWEVDIHGRTAALYELADNQLQAHDPTGRDQRISCGAAVANLELAVRGLGWAAERCLYPSVDRTELVATVTGTHRSPGTAVERALALAMPRRHSHRRAFHQVAVPDAVIDELIGDTATPTIDVRPVAGQAVIRQLGELLAYVSRVFRHDHGYQRELAAWTVRRGERGPGHFGRGIATEALSTAAMPIAGLVRHSTPQVDGNVLAERIAAETVLVLSAAEDSSRHQVLGGIAVERLWLSAITHGLVASILTQPLLLSEVRSAIRLTLELDGYPQVLMRLGYPQR